MKHVDLDKTQLGIETIAGNAEQIGQAAKDSSKPKVYPIKNIVIFGLSISEVGGGPHPPHYLREQRARRGILVRDEDI